ncbi:MAG: right-handed parallel beta-helix repeat-containing protein, partial [Bdellovibrionaceae bacterium]|nr:right-handed parallel beta-helix repeat-containing protein [Pseudobdellovibrionaceae bacterium]
NSNFKNSAGKILNLDGITKSAILDSKFTNSANAAIEIDNSSDIVVARVHVSNADQGIYAYSSPKVYFSEISSVGVDGYSLEFDGSNLGTATAVSAINSAYVGIDLWDSSNVTIHNALAINVDSNAIGGGSSTTITGNTWSQLAIGDSPVALGVSNSTSSKVTGNIVFAGNATNCSATNSGSGFTSACANAGSSDATILNKAGASFQSSIAGKVYSDIQNSSDTNGAVASYPAAINVGAFDFLNFASWYRSWGIDGAVFPNSNHRGRFAPGGASGGRIWDSRPYTNDTHIFNRTHALTTANTAISANAACPAQLRGDVFLTDQQSRKYLKNAIEFVGDSLGNENGLCESNEVCVYTPNFGGYQGEGALFSNTCTFSDNGDATNNVTGVTMYFYPANGVVPTS